MPTVLVENGWRLFFYTNERNEPPHIHALKGDMECKYWLLADRFDIKQEYAYNLSPSAQRQIQRIIFENLEYLLGEYRRIHGSHNE